MCTNTILVFHRLTDPPSLVCLLGEVSSLCLNLRLSSLLAVVWSAVATPAGWCFHWIWPDQFTTAYPDLSDGLYLLFHLIASDVLVSNGLVEYLAKLGLRQWVGNESKEGPASPPGGGLQPDNEFERDSMSGPDDYHLRQPLNLTASNQTQGYGTGGTDGTN